MFGTESTPASAETSDQAELLDRLESVLDRRVQPIAALPALRDSLGKRLDGTAASTLDISMVAFGLDTNIVLRLIRGEPRLTDLRDYLVGGHRGPLILPGQVLQEVWNNINSLGQASKSVNQDYERLKQNIPSFEIDEALHEEFSDLLRRFEERYKFLLKARQPGGGLTESAIGLLEELEQRAEVSYVPRLRFSPLAEIRDSTKTPPGFKDRNDGDFFVWADFLLGLLQTRNRGVSFEAVVLVTEDAKSDWGYLGVAHPLLVAEVGVLLDVPFEIWNLERFDTVLKMSSP